MSSELNSYRVVVTPHHETSNHNLTTAAQQLQLTAVHAIYPSRLFFVQGKISRSDVQTVADNLLADPVTERYTITPIDTLSSSDDHLIDVTMLPGVTDPAADNLIDAARLLNIQLDKAATGQTYRVVAAEDNLDNLATRVLANPVVQQMTINRPIAPPFVEDAAEDSTVEIVALTQANDDELLAISKERRLSMDLAEMQAIRAYYQTEEREPTDVELEMLAQTWSEHCVHKTFRATIDYTGPDGNTETIHNLLKTYIVAATEKINKPWVRSTFVDDAGIVRFDDHFDLAFKAETHNHPSALEPFGGANTGVGGVIRDILGVSARPIANTDVLCFGMPDMPVEDVPEGVLHPSRIADGVIHGIEDYGNKMGIPTVNGSIVYHDGYTSNPLVYCGCVGILPHGSHHNDAEVGDLIVSLGGRVGRDGLRGATFSSMEMDQTTSEIAGSSVQIGHPIMEKQVLELLLKCRDANLYTAITDCGAGGWSSSVGEMGEKVGATVQLKNAGLKYPGLRPWEIWLSEAQERIVIAVPPEKLPQVQAFADGQDVEVTVLGEFDGSKRMRLLYGETVVGDLTMEFLHDGLPTRHLEATWDYPTPDNEAVIDLLPAKEALLKLLAHPTIRSKEDVVRRYDHEVQTGTAVKPLVGVADHGPSDATVIVPQDTLQKSPDSTRAFSLSNGICPTYGALDPYAMAWAAVDEAMRNLVAVGTNPDEISILDNFCWGNPLLPDRLGALVRCTQGCHDAAVAYRTPFISGKDSLNNEYVGIDGEKHAIPGTILISALGIVPDVNQTVTMDLKQAGNSLYLLGETRNEMGGSYYAILHGETGGTAPQPLLEGLQRYRTLYRAIKGGLVEACHDLCEGGLAVALAEMALAGRLGAEIDLKALVADIAHDDILLFSESIGRFIIEVSPENEEAFNQIMIAEKVAKVGQVVADNHIQVTGYDASVVVDATLDEVEIAWRGSVKAVSEQSPATTKSYPVVTRQSSSPRVAVLHANGTNRDRDAALACDLAGGTSEIIHLNQLLAGERQLNDYGMLVVPGGFSYGDDLGAGVLFSAELQHRLGDQLRAFVADGRPTMGICNGFQTLVKANVFDVDGSDVTADKRQVTLTYNERGHFECRWVYLEPNQASTCLFTAGMSEPIYCPVAHGEGRFMTIDDDVAQLLAERGLIALTYQAATYPFNPNGSVLNIAGITNRAGNVLGLMPHPENHIFDWQHPRSHRGEGGFDGLRLFVNGINKAKSF